MDRTRIYGVERDLDSEVFRFALIRSQKEYLKTTQKLIQSFSRLSSNGFIRNLRSARAAGDRDRMLNIANEFIKSVEFVDYLPKFDPKYVDLTFVVRDYSNKPSDSYFEENFKRIFFPT